MESQAFAKLLGIAPSTVSKYQKLGWTSDEIEKHSVKLRKQKCAKWSYRGYTYTVKQWAQILETDRRALTNRAQYLRRNLDLDYAESNTETLHCRYEEIQNRHKLNVKPPSHHDTTGTRQEPSQ